MARSSSFAQEIADEICERIVQGESVRHICDDEKMPAASTVFKWLRDLPKFSEQYARAKEAQTDTMAEEILDIAEDSRNDWIEKENKRTGETFVALNHEAIERSRLRIEARKWLMGKLRPKKYGERLELAGAVEHHYAARVPSTDKNAEQWQQQHSPVAPRPTMQ